MSFFEKRNGDIAVGRIVALVCAVIAIILIAFSITIIPTGYTGVKTTFGQVSTKPIPSGFSVKIPIVQRVEKVNNKQQNETIEGQIWSETSERAALYYEGIKVTYQISAEKSSWLVANVTNYKKNIITTEDVNSAVKAASKELPNVDATSRGKIEPLAQQKLQEILDSKYGKEAIHINRINISNADFEESYNEAIAAKQNAQLEYERAAIVNQQAIEKAEADAKAKEKAAEGEANALKIKAEAEAAANKKISESLNDKVLANKYYESWDGKLPSVVGEGQVILPSSVIGGTAAADNK